MWIWGTAKVIQKLKIDRVYSQKKKYKPYSWEKKKISLTSSQRRRIKTNFYFQISNYYRIFKCIIPNSTHSTGSRICWRSQRKDSACRTGARCSQLTWSEAKCQKGELSYNLGTGIEARWQGCGEQLSRDKNRWSFMACHKSTYSSLPDDYNCRMELALTSDGRTIVCYIFQWAFHMNTQNLSLGQVLCIITKKHWIKYWKPD